VAIRHPRGMFLKVIRTAPAIAAVSVLICNSARGQWVATDLHPAGAYLTVAGGANATTQAGRWQATPFSSTKPVIWHGTAASMVNLAPGATDFGRLYGLHGDTQFGTFNGRAAIWSGTPQSRVDLQPASLPGASDVFGMNGTQQVGDYFTPGVIHAALWNGTANSFVDLHPGGGPNSGSTAFATDGSQQGGKYYSEFVAAHAVLWSGTAASMVDLNPASSIGSTIYGMVPGQQAGYATFGTPGLDHAGIWSGTAASFIDLNPPGSTSQLTATCGTAQVGQVGGSDAAIWFGTAGSVVNLGSFLPPNFSYSVATSVFEQNGTFYVGGWGQQSSSAPQEALLWVGVPAPSELAVLGVAGIWAARRRRVNRRVT
jgi:hypothetical protein